MTTSPGEATGALQPLLDILAPGQTIYLPGATGEILGLIPELQAQPACLDGVCIVSCFVPGMNEFDYAGLHPGVRILTFMLPQAMRDSYLDGRISLVPRSYIGVAHSIAGLHYDIAVAHVAPADSDGLCSMGIASDFTALAWRNAHRRVLVVNAAMPDIPRAGRLPIADADMVVYVDSPIVTAEVQNITEEMWTMAQRIAALIPDGASLQSGIGGAPGVFWRALKGHRNIILRSGMATPGFRELAEAGALAEGADHVAGIAYGDMDFYRYLAETDLVRFVPVPETHGAIALADAKCLHAVNSALELDLFGQVNVEWRGSALFGGVGGAPDFARAALNSEGGRSIIVLPTTAKRGTISRIVSRLTSPSVSLARSEVDTVVTEFGVAELRGLDMDARARALIAIAHPHFRDELEQCWRAIREENP